MEITALINHPELMDRDTLYELRATLALHPYHQTARLLMLQNLYLLHDQAFDQELRKAAIYLTDRKKLFQMIEGAHYQWQKRHDGANAEGQKGRGVANATATPEAHEDRTEALIDSFLGSMPTEEEEKPHRKPTPADAAVDYVAYLLESDSYADEPALQMKGQELIDQFLEQEQGRISLQLPAVNEPHDTPEEAAGEDEVEEEFFTETLARIYIRQGRYQKALDIITRLNNRMPAKNSYFADQIRFLEKLIINNNNNKNLK